MLLIVPYGIETFDPSSVGRLIYLLLIVPYGIETEELKTRMETILTFNRTLWN